VPLVLNLFIVKGLLYIRLFMRIIAGQNKGMKLMSPKGNDIRPTADKVREYIFSCLYVDGNKTVLDLFAGSGAFGLEALSRGAASSTFVDISRSALELAKKNAEKAGAYSQSRFYQRKATSFLRDCDTTFDIIFCDPPYKYDNFDKILYFIKEYQVLQPQGYVIYEYGSYLNKPETSDFKTVREKKMGNTRVHFYQYE